MIRQTNRIRLEPGSRENNCEIIKVYIDDKPINTFLTGDALFTAFEMDNYFIVFVSYEYVNTGFYEADDYDAEAKFIYFIEKSGIYIERILIGNMIFNETLHIDKYENNSIEFSYTKNKKYIYKFRLELFENRKFIFKFRLHWLSPFSKFRIWCNHLKWIPFQKSYYNMQLEIIETKI